MSAPNCVQTFKDSILGNIFPLIVSVIVAIAAIWLLWLYVTVTSSSFNGQMYGANFKLGDESLEQIILFPALGMLAISALFTWFSFKFTMKRSFELHHNRLVSNYKNKFETSVEFKNMNEVYRFRTFQAGKRALVPYGLLDVLAYRENKQDFWKVIRPILREKGKKHQGTVLIEKIIEEYVQATLPPLLDSLNRGETKDFIYLHERESKILSFSQRDILDQSLFYCATIPLKSGRTSESTKDYGNCIETTCKLSKKGIDLNGFVPFALGDEIIMQNYDLGKFMGSNPKDFEVAKVIMIVNNNKIKVTIDMTRLINADLFLATIKQFIQGFSIN